MSMVPLSQVTVHPSRSNRAKVFLSRKGAYISYFSISGAQSNRRCWPSLKVSSNMYSPAMRASVTHLSSLFGFIALIERIDCYQRFSFYHALPVSHKLILMSVEPLKYELQSATGHLTCYRPCLNINGSTMLIVTNMEMRRIVIGKYIVIIIPEKREISGISSSFDIITQKFSKRCVLQGSTITSAMHINILYQQHFSSLSKKCRNFCIFAPINNRTKIFAIYTTKMLPLSVILFPFAKQWIL